MPRLTFSGFSGMIAHHKRMMTEREVEVLVLLKGGASDVEIGRALGISEETVAFHLRNVFGKLKVNSRTDAVLEWMGMGN